jgi:hypothetical protein
MAPPEVAVRDLTGTATGSTGDTAGQDYRTFFVVSIKRLGPREVWIELHDALLRYGQLRRGQGTGTQQR